MRSAGDRPWQSTMLERALAGVSMKRGVEGSVISSSQNEWARHMFGSIGDIDATVFREVFFSYQSNQMKYFLLN